VDKESFN